MIPLTEGALDKIMQGVTLEKPILQYLGHKKLSSNSSGERYRLLFNDGVNVNSFAMLATQLNHMITDNILIENSICRINKFAISMVNNNGQQRRVMIILGIEVLVPGTEVCKQIGNAQNLEGTKEESTSFAKSAAPIQNNRTTNLNQSIPGGGGSIAITPIAALSPYQNRWVIKARVTNKSDKRSWSNARGEGTLFSMDLLDESGEIRCTAFRDQCEKYYDMIEVGKIYYISRCVLKPANKQFTTLKNDYEMTLSNDSEIVPCNDDVSDIPTVTFDFQPISSIEQKEKNELIDVMGIVKQVSDLQTVMTRNTGRELKKRDITIVDESGTEVSLTLWGQQADTFDGNNNTVVAIKGARIGEFQGNKNLSVLQSTLVQIDPDIPEAHQLRGWYNSSGKNIEIKSLSKLTSFGAVSGPMLTFKEVKDQRLGQKDIADVYVSKATITFIKTDNSLYKSCPTENCKKKIVDQSNGMYRCEKCDREYPNFKYRMLASLSIADWTDSQWVTAFSEEAEKLFGISAQELGELMENDNNMYLEKLSEATFTTHLFKLRVRLENYNDESRLKTIVLSASPMNYKTYNNHLLERIKEYANIGKI